MKKETVERIKQMQSRKVSYPSTKTRWTVKELRRAKLPEQNRFRTPTLNEWLEMMERKKKVEDKAVQDLSDALSRIGNDVYYFHELIRSMIEELACLGPRWDAVGDGIAKEEEVTAEIAEAIQEFSNASLEFRYTYKRLMTVRKKMAEYLKLLEDDRRLGE